MIKHPTVSNDWNPFTGTFEFKADPLENNMIGNWKNLDLQEKVLIRETKED
jgi:hypothetical protein